MPVLILIKGSHLIEYSKYTSLYFTVKAKPLLQLSDRI